MRKLTIDTQKAFTAIHTRLYRATGGRVGGRFHNTPVLLLDSIGRKSGERRTTPVMYMPDGERWIVVASAGGSPRNPAWWLNLRAVGTGSLQVGRDRVEVTAAEVSDDDRARLWPELVRMYPGYGEYEKKTHRKIPVVALERAAEK